MTDAAAENSETNVWLNFARSFNYVAETEVEKLKKLSIEVGKRLNYMINNSDKFGVST